MSDSSELISSCDAWQPNRQLPQFRIKGDFERRCVSPNTARTADNGFYPRLSSRHMAWHTAESRIRVHASTGHACSRQDRGTRGHHVRGVAHLQMSYCLFPRRNSTTSAPRQAQFHGSMYTPLHMSRLPAFHCLSGQHDRERSCLHRVYVVMPHLFHGINAWRLLQQVRQAESGMSSSSATPGSPLATLWFRVSCS